MALCARGLAIGWAGGKEKRILARGVELALRGGDFAALVGPNGSGKSTLLRSLVGAQPILEGEVELGGESLSGLSVEERALRAASVFTGRLDSGWFTLRDIVAFGRYPFTDARNRLRDHDLAAVDSAIAAVGLDTLAARRFMELSDGERQKAMIARAIAQDCPLLVLDEPTAFLDVSARVEIFHLARRLAREEGRAVVLSTHDLDPAIRYADSLWLLDGRGGFVCGPPERLALSGDLGRAFDGPALRFDPVAGVFSAVEETRLPLIALTGGDARIRLWTERLARRLGFELADGLDPELSLFIEGVADSPRWRLRGRGAELSFADMGLLSEELARRR